MILQHFLWGGGWKFWEYFFNWYAVNINQKVAGFYCTFYNYLDGFEQVCSSSHQSSNHPKQYVQVQRELVLVVKSDILAKLFLPLLILK